MKQPCRARERRQNPEGGLQRCQMYSSGIYLARRWLPMRRLSKLAPCDALTHHRLMRVFSCWTRTTLCLQLLGRSGH